MSNKTLSGLRSSEQLSTINLRTMMRAHALTYRENIAPAPLWMTPDFNRRTSMALNYLKMAIDYRNMSRPANP